MQSHVIWQAIANTPWWVFALFVYLIKVGYTATRPRIIPINAMLIIPTIFLALATIGLFKLTNLNGVRFAWWLSAIIVGGSLGWHLCKSMGITAIKDSQRIHVPGTWSVLIIFLILFIIKYFLNYEMTTHADFLKHALARDLLLISYGGTTGFFIGRIYYAIHCVKNGPYLQA
jgi:hypothetical protein